METPDISMAFKETSCKSLSGVDTRNSGSQLCRLQNKTAEIEEKKNETHTHTTLIFSSRRYKDLEYIYPLI